MNARSLNAVVHLAAAVAAGLGFATATSESAQAAPILSRSEAGIDALAQVQGPGGTMDHQPLRSVPSGDPTLLEAFVQPVDRGWAAYRGGTPTNLSVPFASAVVNGAGFAGVGVSGGLDDLDFGVMQASAGFQQKVVNTGSAGPISLTYSIPLIEIATVGNRYQGDVGLVKASMVAIRANSLGQVIEDISLFDYSLTFNYIKPPTTFAIQTFTASSDLLNDSGGLVNIDPNCALAACNTGKKILPFSATKAIPHVDPGDQIFFDYSMSTLIHAGREGGGHALYGDPFGITAGPGAGFLTFSVGQVAVDPAPRSVPEPGTLLLAFAGLAGLGAFGRRAS